MSAIRNLILGRLPSYTRKSRHVSQLLRYGRPKKFLNLLHVEWSLKRGKTKLNCFPYIYIIDPCNVCNLRCPLCPTGARNLQRPQGMLSFECFQSIVNQIKEYAIEINLYSWGEPFLNRDIFKMIRYAHEARIGTNLSSHFNGISDELIEQIIDSGLDEINVSIDGATQEVYEIYRRRGNLENALTSLEKLQRRKREKKSQTPVVEWQFIVMKHNEHQIDKARNLAQELGVEKFRLLGVGLPFDDLTNLQLAAEWMPEDPHFRNYHPEKILQQGYLYDEPCFYLYRTLVINPKGEVAPCCAIHHKKWDFGNIIADDLPSIWNNERYQSARSLFSYHPIDNRTETVCDICPLFKWRSVK
jgi:radical SAM protein with 4Fe4S-binding SPASM domain